MSAADDLKAQLKALMDQRSALEAEIAQRSARLEAAAVGMSGALVDGEGYPRADVDVAAIRSDRHAIITLTNDHKALTQQMETLLHRLHALPSNPAAFATPVSQPLPIAAAIRQPQAGDGHASMANGSSRHSSAGPANAPAQPFAVVDEVTAGSPAEEAGLQLGDQLCSFAGVTRHAANTLQAVAAALQANEGRAVQTTVLRRGLAVELLLTPQQWAGRGLLGCHLRPL